MNVEIGAEAAQFPEKEYINGIAVTVHQELKGIVIHIQIISQYPKFKIFHISVLA